VRSAFRTVFDNEDTRTYAVARRVLEGQHTWLERGTV